MAQTSVQYTPVQVLQAARRAEAEGKMDYALQFYRHIVEHHGTSAEAQEAREGLFRIAEWRWGEARIARRQEAGGANGYGGGHANTQRVAPAPSPAASAVAPAPGASAATAQANAQPAYNAPEPAEQNVPVTGVTRMPQIIAREAAKAAEAEEPTFRAHFRGARLVAFLLSGCGWASVVGGLAIAFLALTNSTGEIAAEALLGVPLGVVLGVPATVVGLVLVVGAYLAVAVFESANATLEMLSMRRRRAGY